MVKSIYIILGAAGKYKIGVSDNPKKRLETLAIGNHQKLEVVFASKKVENAAKIEHFIHKKFKSNRLNGEWFELDENKLKSVIDLIDESVNNAKEIEPESRTCEEIFNELENIFGFMRQIEKLRKPLIDNSVSISDEMTKNKDTYEFLQYILFSQNGGVYSELIYKTIFGKSLKELQEQFGVKAKESIREYMTAEQLKEVESMEMLISSLINIGMGYEEVKQFINEKCHPAQLLSA